MARGSHGGLSTTWTRIHFEPVWSYYYSSVYFGIVVSWRDDEFNTREKQRRSEREMVKKNSI